MSTPSAELSCLVPHLGGLAKPPFMAKERWWRRGSREKVEGQALSVFGRKCFIPTKAISMHMFCLFQLAPLLTTHNYDSKTRHKMQGWDRLIFFVETEANTPLTGIVFVITVFGNYPLKAFISPKNHISNK